jgi:hypothetical protein
MPRLCDPPSAWHHLADRLPDGSPDIETGVMLPETIARAAALKLELVPTKPSDVGRPIVAGFYLDVVAREVCDAAGMLDHARRFDWQPLVDWLHLGLDPDRDILPVIRRVAARGSYQPPGSLRYFNQAVRERAA